MEQGPRVCVNKKKKEGWESLSISHATKQATKNKWGEKCPGFGCQKLKREGGRGRATDERSHHTARRRHPDEHTLLTNREGVSMTRRGKERESSLQLVPTGDPG
jgi:hypothetical protein